MQPRALARGVMAIALAALFGGVPAAQADELSITFADPAGASDNAAGVPRTMTIKGVNVEADEMTGEPAQLVLRASFLEQNYDAGVFVGDSEATLEGC